MKVELLTSAHADSVRGLFSSSKYMGVGVGSNFSGNGKEDQFNSELHQSFCETYLSDLNSYKAFGSVEDGAVTSLISFYESSDNPEWFWTQIRSSNSKAIPFVLDEVMDYNEKNGRMKFYSLFNKKYENSMRKFAFSEKNDERYDFFDEFYVPAKHKCYYLTPWQSLYIRTLLPVETIVRCTFLKQKYRTTLPLGGGL